MDETAEVGWVPIDGTPAMIAGDEILGAITTSGCSMPCRGGQSIA